MHIKYLSSFMVIFILSILLSGCEEGQTCSIDDAPCLLKSNYDVDYHSDDNTDEQLYLVACGKNKNQICATTYARQGQEYDFEGETYLVISDYEFRLLVDDDTLSDAEKAEKYETLVTTHVKNMSHAFGAPGTTGSFNNSAIAADVTHWDVSHVTSMLAMFYQNTTFGSDISEWNVSKVVQMTSMFQEANISLTIDDWNVSSVEEMESMFESNPVFNGNIRGWNVSNVKIMIKMFYNATSFNQDLSGSSGWNVSSVRYAGRFCEFSAMYNPGFNAQNSPFKGSKGYGTCVPPNNNDTAG